MPFVFPPMIAAGVAALGVAALGRVLMKEWRRINEELEQMRPVEVVDPARLPKLRRDPRTGVYRPE
ncbi:hypothetical protein GJ689_00045 [Rhodoplanes serenus]|jgi:hypothetical protein|uniref:Uncharacterized protein n=1 Tax=Rhodoplanes serenus TaxID=200615 RepID=A0A327JUT0_9BRAD|nr:hypothetical protein [Rhodoplanes serenus]MBI5110766.1 hypothetical protein [Rhodovulum sp.]MTW14604.1 hypothetical protein [Rhodoplanes serenus]RAI29243.1 hypothetical protein CH340_22985 [Rhodoplanes serenus]